MRLVFPSIEKYQMRGCLPRSTLCSSMGTFDIAGRSDSFPVIPRTDWKESSFRHKVYHVIDQNPQKSCCPSAVCGASMIAREIAGLDRIIFSQASLYRFINQGRDSGSNIDDALLQLMKVGVAPASLIPQYNWQGNGWPLDWDQSAAKYKLFEAFDCPTFDAVASAVQFSMPVPLGVYWGNRGHAITAVGLKRVKNSWGIEILNSWGSSWGDEGFGVLPESECRGIESFGAFAIRSMVLPTEESGVPLILGV